MGLDLTKLNGHVPQSIYENIIELFPDYEIDTKFRASHFLGQIAHESGDFTIKTESLNYTTPERIVKIWPSRFNLTGDGGKKNANNYIKNQEKLSEAVYGGRMGNNNPGDGFTFRGAGFLQLTGKDAFIGYSKYIDKSVEDTADLIRSDNHYALDCALWEYCDEMKLNTIADQGIDDIIIKKITKRINGGYNGLEDRLNKVNKYYSWLQ